MAFNTTALQIVVIYHIYRSYLRKPWIFFSVYIGRECVRVRLIGTIEQRRKRFV